MTDDPIEPPLTSAQRHAATCLHRECLENPNRAAYQRRLACELDGPRQVEVGEGSS